MNSPQHSVATERSQTRTCEQHGAYESIGYGHGEYPVWSPCPICRKATVDRAKERDEREAEHRRAERNRELLSCSAIPLRYRDSTLESFRADNDGQRAALRIATRLAGKIVEEPRGGWSLILCGNVGTGKTHLACAIALTALAADLQPRYETVLSAMRSIKATYAKDSTITEQDAIDELVGYDLLILDEVGVQVGSEYEKTLLFEVINERYQWRRSTLLISNLTQEALAGYLGERTMDRFRETGGVVPFGWESQRGKARG